jgi:fatty acid desaturase
MIKARQLDPYSRYRTTLLAPDRVRALSQLTPSVVVRDVAFCWTTIIAAWAAAAAYPTWWVCAIAAVVVGTRYYALFIIGHDGLHRRLWPSQQGNDLFNDVLILGPLGAITRLNNRNHLLHHRHLGNAEDPDRHRHACFNKADRLELLGFLSGATSVVRAVYHVFLAGRKRHVVLPEDTAAMDPAESEARADSVPATDGLYRLRDLVILGTWQVALILGLTLAFGWWGYPAMWLAPVYVFTFLADNFRSFVEHSHPEPDQHADRHRLVTFESSPLERLFIAPMHMNLHVAHHLWVGIPYYHLPEADREMCLHPLSKELERRRSYLGYLLRYWLALPLEDCRRPHRVTR